MLIGMKEMLTVAKENHFAVGAFNATQSELLRAVVEEAEATDTPAIIEVSFGEFSFATPDFYAYARERLGNSRVPFVLHLDHGHSLEECMQVMRAGFTSVMIDGSMLSYDENVEQTKQVVELAHMVGVDVEAEIGIQKVNISSDFKHAFFQAVGKMIATGEIVPAKVLTPGIEAARKVIAHKMDVFGSVGKAVCYR